MVTGPAGIRGTTAVVQGRVGANSHAVADLRLHCQRCHGVIQGRVESPEAGLVYRRNVEITGERETLIWGKVPPLGMLRIRDMPPSEVFSGGLT